MTWAEERRKALREVRSRVGALGGAKSAGRVYPRAACSSCGRVVPLRADGRPRSHHGPGRIIHCPGGLLPAVLSGSDRVKVALVPVHVLQGGATYVDLALGPVDSTLVSLRLEQDTQGDGPPGWFSLVPFPPGVGIGALLINQVAVAAPLHQHWLPFGTLVAFASAVLPARSVLTVRVDTTGAGSCLLRVQMREVGNGSGAP